MGQATRALVLAIVSAVAFPFLFFIQVVAVMFAGMVTYEPNNPWFIKVASVLVVALIGVACLALPATALWMGARARRAIKSSDGVIVGSSRAIAAQVVSGVVLAGAVIVQGYLVFWAAGACSLDGC